MTDKKVATVIGVGPGLGAALARRFAADYAVALVARNGEKLIEFAREISAAGGSSLVVPADVSKVQEIASRIWTETTTLGSDGVRFEPDLTLREIDVPGAQTWIGFTQEYSAAEVVSVMFNRS